MPNNSLVYNLEDSIQLGYGLIENLEKEYQRSDSSQVSGLLDKFYRITEEWMAQVCVTLPNQYRKTLFRNAVSTNPTGRVGWNIDVYSLIKSIRAKINKLEEFRKEETSTTSAIVASGHQSRIYINSTDNSVNISNEGTVQLINELEQEFKDKYNEEDKEEVLNLINKLRDVSEKNEKVGFRKVLGSLLTRGAEISQIVSLIVQLTALSSGMKIN